MHSKCFPLPYGCIDESPEVKSVEDILNEVIVIECGMQPESKVQP